MDQESEIFLNSLYLLHYCNRHHGLEIQTIHQN